jgi:hypothetical protein
MIVPPVGGIFFVQKDTESANFVLDNVAISCYNSDENDAKGDMRHERRQFTAGNQGCDLGCQEGAR